MANNRRSLKDQLGTATDFSFCLSALPVIYTFTGNVNWTLPTNWSNNLRPPPVLSERSEVIIDPPAGAECVLNIPYTVTRQTRLSIKPGKKI